MIPKKIGIRKPQLNNKTGRLKVSSRCMHYDIAYPLKYGMPRKLDYYASNIQPVIANFSAIQHVVSDSINNQHATVK